MLGQLYELWDNLFVILFLICIWLARSFLHFLTIEGGGEIGTSKFCCCSRNKVLFH